MSNEQLADLTQPQRDRLAFVELRVRFIGEIRRQDLVSRFGIQSAAASRDLALYKELAPATSTTTPRASPTSWGRTSGPVFDFPPERVLSWLTQGFGDGEPMRLKAWVASESPSRLTHPDLDVLASVTRAIHQECPLGIEYHSISSGRTEREIVPFALIDNGLRWHVRAFDRKSQEFRDFVITRIKRPWCSRGSQWQPHERAIRTFSGPGSSSWSWCRTRISPGRRSPRWTTACGRRAADEAARRHGRIHPAQMECGLLPDHSLRGHEYRLWLKDHLAIYGVRNAVLAPGYRSPDQQRLEAESD
jgi:hypothetical protein